MKRIFSTLTLTTIAVILAVVSAKAQYDDVYYDPSKDGGTSVTEVYNEPSKPAQNYNKPEQPDGSNDKYYDNDEDYDDYDYYYSSRIRRFDRPMRGFDYFDDCYVSSYNYDPFWTGTTIYVGYDSYWDYQRWRRWNSWNSGPSFGWGLGYGPSFGWNFGYNNYYSPWSCYSYNPYPPYGNVYYNNYYYGNYNGGWYDYGYNHNGNNNYYGNNVYYGPRKGGGSLTELKGNPRGLTRSTPANPRGTTNQTPGVGNPGRNTNSSLPTGVQNANPRGNKDVLIDRNPVDVRTPATNSKPQTQSTKPTIREPQTSRPQTTLPPASNDNKPQVETPRTGRDNTASPITEPRPAKEDKIINKDNVRDDNGRSEREARRQTRLKEIYDAGDRPARREPKVNDNAAPTRQRGNNETEINRSRRIERAPEKSDVEPRQNRSNESTPRVNRSESNSNSGSVRPSAESSPKSSGNNNSSSSNPRSGRK